MYNTGSIVKSLFVLVDKIQFYKLHICLLYYYSERMDSIGTSLHSL